MSHVSFSRKPVGWKWSSDISCCLCNSVPFECGGAQVCLCRMIFPDETTCLRVLFDVHKSFCPVHGSFSFRCPEYLIVVRQFTGWDQHIQEGMYQLKPLSAEMSLSRFLGPVYWEALNRRLDEISFDLPSFSYNSRIKYKNIKN